MWQSKEDIKNIQDKKVRRHLKYCIDASPFYKKMFSSSAIELSTIDSSSVSSLPLTEKNDIAEDNESFLAVESKKIVDIVLSSGTTGDPIRFHYTDADLKRLAYNEECSLRACGIEESDIVLLTCTMDRCFIAGLAYFLGVRNIGAAAIRNGHGTLASHAYVLEQMMPTVIVGVPSFLRKLAVYMKTSHPAVFQNHGVHSIVCIGEPIRGQDMTLLQVGSDLEALWGARVYSTYASSETITTFCECSAQAGGHVHPDLALVEIVDDVGVVLPSGRIGEVVVTPFDIEGMPLVRYKTGDISFLIDEPCSCGNIAPRLGPIVGRKNQMLKCKGTTFYPQTIYNALDGIDGVGEYYVEVFEASDLADDLVICVVLDENTCSLTCLEELLAARLRVKPTIHVCNDNDVRRQVFSPESRKPIRFFDRR